MKLAILFIAAIATILAGCVRQPNGDVFSSIRKQAGPNSGEIFLTLNPAYVSAAHRAETQVLVLVNPRDENGSVRCVLTPMSADEDVWVDSSGYRWMAIGASSTISYVKTDRYIDIAVDDVATTRCPLQGSGEVTLNVLFTARPMPFGWSGDQMHGFEVAIPDR